jgi:hypothetical protein
MRQVGAVVAVMAAACVVADSNEVPETSEVVQHADEEDEEEGPRCPPFRCSNSPEVIHLGIHEMNLFGTPDERGYFLDTGGRTRAQIWDANGRPWDLYVQGNRFVGVSHDGSSQLTGSSLLHAHLRVRQRFAQFTRLTFLIYIDTVRRIEFPVGIREKIEVYQLGWFEPGSGARGTTVCNGPYPTNTDPNQDPMLGMLPHETLIFAGDRIDPETMTTSKQADYAWLNFGCAGHTLAKLHLTRNTITSQPTPDWARRQAMLKLLVADYCGNGQPMTIPKTPLRWKTELVPYFPTPKEIEARWTENGASCLSNPRLGNYDEYFDDVESSIRLACAPAAPPPPCTNTDLHDFDGKLRVSAIPYSN